MLTLAENLLLLSLDDETGSFHRISDISLDLALVGATLMDLALLERLDLDKDKLWVISAQTTRNPLFDRFLELAAKEERGCDPAILIRDIYVAIPSIRKDLLSRLEERGIVELKDEKILGLFHNRKYPVKDNREELAVVSRLRSIVIEGSPPDQADIVLIALLCTCDLIDLLFTKEELQAHQARLELLKSMDIIAHAVQRIIAEIQLLVASSYLA